MTRFAVAVSVGLLLVGVGASAQSEAKPAPKPKQSDSKQQSSDATQSSGAARAASPSTQNPDDLLNSPTTPIPGSAEKAQKPQPKPHSSDDPDSLLNSPMTPPGSDKPASEQFPFPESEEKGSYSSSKDTQGDISALRGDSLHPGADIGKAPGDVQETKPWDPHKADKDVEVGTFYFKRGNYKGAEMRFRDALVWQDNHAEAMYRLGETLQKEGRLLEAQMYYENYLKILPHGEFAADCKKEIDKINDTEQKKTEKASTSPSL